MKIVNLTLEVLLLDIFIAAPDVEEDKFEIQVRCMSTINTNLNKYQTRGGYN